MSQTNWADYWYLVAIPSGQLFTEAQRIQYILAENLKVYADSPPPIHITICKIKPLSQAQLHVFSKQVQDILTDFHPITINANNFDCFSQAHQSLVLKINHNEQLFQLKQRLQALLKMNNFFVPTTIQQWIFHITLISELFAQVPLDTKHFDNVCQRLSLIDSHLEGVIHSLELWRPVLPFAERVVEQYPLAKAKVKRP